MGPRRDRGGFLKVATGAAVLVAVAGTAAVIVWGRRDWPVSPGISSRAEELRERFPFESLADRLAYEGDGPDGADLALPEPTAARLNEVEKQFDTWKAISPRMQSLAKLHSDQVEEFVNQEGFGNGRRLHMTSPSYLSLPEAAPVPFASVPALPPGGEGSRVDLPERAEEPALSLRGLGEFHDRGRFAFLDPGDFGFVRDRDHVAGFRSHSFWRMPELRDPMRLPSPAADRWALSRLELVSLLKHSSPAVYLSDHLPRMDDLKKSETRPPSEFEAKALESIRNGEDLVAEATTNRILLMGTMRATRQCLDCHRVHRGDLLGAFSYELRRDPAGK
jgi:hypothetical protein